MTKASRIASLVTDFVHQKPATSEVNVSVSTDGDAVSYEADVKPLFRDRDRDSMESHFDLWSYDDVREHAPAILSQLEAGTMPCDGAWPDEQVDVVRRWVAQGTPA